MESDRETIEELRAQVSGLQVIVRSLYVILADADVLPREQLIADLRLHEESQRRQNAHAGQILTIRALHQALAGEPPPDE